MELARSAVRMVVATKRWTHGAILGGCLAFAAFAACSSETSSGSAGDACAGSASEVSNRVFAKSCTTSGCHAAGDKAGSLDLESPGIEMRLVGRASAECDGQTLIVPKDEAGSYLLSKLASDSPACGSRMPFGSEALGPDDMACLKAWIGSLDPASVPADAGGQTPTVGCEVGLMACGQSCVDTQSDPKHCGQCDRACPVACFQGGCVDSCPAPTDDCSGACIDKSSNQLHCGGCDTPCTGGTTCTGGQCSCGAAVSFASDLQPVFNASCNDTPCHGGRRPQADLNLTGAQSFGALVGAASARCQNRTRVVPGDVAASYLMNKLTGVGMCQGSQMPKGASALPADTIAKFQAWICRGAQNN